MAQTDVLLTREPAPQTVQVCELPRKEYEVERNTGAYTSSGLATAGFRTAKYLVDEWFQNCYARYHQAFADRDQSERHRHESQQLAAETEALAQRTQEDSTRKVGERLQDTHGWKSELQRQIWELLAETDLLLAQKVRLERALDAMELPYSIAMDNLQCRERRQHPDLVRDYVEMELLKEAELIRNIQELLKRTILQAVEQIRLVLTQTLREITDQEHNVAALKQAIKDKEAPLKVAQTRLYQRSYRPNVELCRDAAQFRLVSEVEELNMSLTALKEKLLEAEQSLRNLEDTRMSLEKDIAVKVNSLFIDRQKCMAHRARYPTILRLAGYQ
ncbi:PREDICTED: tektin-4-like [Chrysochloris asiatica]|uniref:Tektin n=1 Tax=Chrysochloris asiatica TaxID=185453 RepID=A0A9B0WZT3_CHRAS|nr:PREDICTED: tektin-4-like [Chrysochloris asiatica]